MPKVKSRTPDEYGDDDKEPEKVQEQPTVDEEAENQLKSIIAKQLEQVEDAFRRAVRENFSVDKAKAFAKERLILNVKHLFDRNFRVNVYSFERNLVKSRKIIASFYVFLQKGGEIYANPPFDEVLTEKFSFVEYNKPKNNAKKALFS